MLGLHSGGALGGVGAAGDADVERVDADVAGRGEDLTGVLPVVPTGVDLHAAVGRAHQTAVGAGAGLALGLVGAVLAQCDAQALAAHQTRVDLLTVTAALLCIGYCGDEQVLPCTERGAVC